MIEISLIKEEWYPIYSVGRVKEANSGQGLIKRKISEEKLKWVEDTYQQFRDVLAFLDDLYDKKI